VLQRASLFAAEVAEFYRVVAPDIRGIVDGDSVQPGTESPSRVVAVKVAVGIDQRVLQGILRVRIYVDVRVTRKRSKPGR
jgi:hypothetical protein